MREIKFRGKDSFDVWIFGGIAEILFAGDEEESKCIIDKKGFYTKIPFRNIDTIGQFTGFKDIDGKEIFEGDIIQNEVNPFEVYQVAMVNGYWSAEKKVDCGVLHWFLENAPYKVIGNIHDNPELLEGGKADDYRKPQKNAGVATL